MKALDAVPKAAQEKIRKHLAEAGTVANGWRLATQGIGTYGTDYLQRATVTAAGLGARAKGRRQSGRSYRRDWSGR